MEVTFSEEKYPVLGINIQCFENPKLNTSESKIKKYLIDDEEIN